MVYAQKVARPLKLFYDPKTGLYAKARRVRKGKIVEISHNQLKWKEYDALRSIVRDKIAILNMVDNPFEIPSLGSHRQSKMFPQRHMYFIHNETWRI